MKHEFTHPKDAPEGHRWVTAGGQSVANVIYFENVLTDFSIAALINNELMLLNDDGISGIVRIIDAPRTRTVWVNFDSDGIAFPYGTKADALADDYDNDIVARKRVDYVVGEFDE